MVTALTHIDGKKIDEGKVGLIASALKADYINYVETCCWIGRQEFSAGINKSTKDVDMEKSQNLQDVFLNQVRKQHVAVTIFLVNGVKLQGIITWFDNYSILLKRDGHIQLIYKHAVSTIMPSTPLNMQDIEGDENSW